jgi:hypothetical protein
MQYSKTHSNHEVPTLILVELFCHVDDFCILFDQLLASQGLAASRRKPGPMPRLNISEITTITMSHYRSFKHY